MICRQQDDDLDHLGEHVIRIGQMGRQIGEELGQQSTLIDELDADMDGTSNRLAAAQKKMTHVLKKAGLRGQLCIILVLIVLLVVLLLVAFSWYRPDIEARHSNESLRSLQNRYLYCERLVRLHPLLQI